MMTRTLSLLAAASLLASCASPRTAKVPDTMVMTPLTKEEAPAAAPAPAPEEFSGLDTGQLYSLTVKNADIHDTLLLLSRKTGSTIIPDRDVTGTVTVDLQNRTLRDILFAILKPSGYTVYVENSIIRVSKPRLVSRTFNVSYIKDKRTSTSTMNAAIAESGSTGYTPTTSSINLNLSTQGSNGTGSQTGSSGSSQQGNVTVQTSGVSDFWAEMIRGLEVIIFGEATTGTTRYEHGYSRGDRTGKKLVVNELAGIVHVRDLSDNMEQVKSYLDDVELAVKRQVLIQAHIVEVSLNDGFSFGVDWSYLRRYDVGSSNPTTVKLSQGLVPAVPTNVFQFSINNNKVTALLDMMKEQGQLNMLSSPKVSTLNNQRAVIKLTTKEVSWTSNAAYNAQGNILVSYTTPQIDEVGIFLDVTPQINDRGTIAMQIHPSISEKTGTSVSPDGKSSKPIIVVREVDTMADIRNGQTIVIAGLIVDKLSETKRSVPFLGDIPFLGSFFSYLNQEKRKIELVMLITPYVLNDKTIPEITREHEERIGKAGRKFAPTPLAVPSTPGTTTGNEPRQ